MTSLSTRASALTCPWCAARRPSSGHTLRSPRARPTGAIIELTGGSLSVTPGTAPAVTIAYPTPRPTAPFPQLALATSAPLVDSTADPVFVVPGSALAPSTTTARFTATFRVTITYQTRTTRHGDAGHGHPHHVHQPLRHDDTDYRDRREADERAPRSRRADGRRLAGVREPVHRFRRCGAPGGDAHPVADLSGTGGRRVADRDERRAFGTRCRPACWTCAGCSARTAGSAGPAGPRATSTPSRPPSVNSSSHGTRRTGPRTRLTGSSALSTRPSATARRRAARRAWPQSTRTRPGSAPCRSSRAFHRRAGSSRRLSSATRSASSSVARPRQLTATTCSASTTRRTSTPIRSVTNRSYNTRLRSVLVDDRTAMTYIGTANNNNTLLEQLDWAYLICRLGGATSTECPAPAVPVGSGAGVAAGPRFVISGVTDGTLPAQTSSSRSSARTCCRRLRTRRRQYRLVYRTSANGTILSNFGLPVQAEDSAHSDDDDGPATGNSDAVLRRLRLSRDPEPHRALARSARSRGQCPPLRARPDSGSRDRQPQRDRRHRWDGRTSRTTQRTSTSRQP